MALRLNDIAPDFTADSTEGRIDFHDWIGDGYAILFSHPKDFTPVCTTELGMMAGMADEFSKRNAKIIGVSVDPVDDHHKWKSDIASFTGNEVSYPMIGDPEMKVAKLYDMLPASEERTDGRTPADNATVRTVFIIGPDKRVKLSMTYPMTTGRNFDEILRALDSIRSCPTSARRSSRAKTQVSSFLKYLSRRAGPPRAIRPFSCASDRIAPGT